MSDDIKTKIIHYLAQRPDFEGVSTRDIEICNWVADQLKSQLDKAQSDLEREQKCVELAVEALDKLLKKVRQYAEAGCIEAMNPDRDYENGLGAEEDRAIEALTKIKSLRDEK